MTWSVCDGQNKNSEQTWTSIIFVVESGAWSACDGQKKLGCLGGVSILCRPVAPAVRLLSRSGKTEETTVIPVNKYWSNNYEKRQ